MYHVSHMDRFYYFYGAFLASTDVVTMNAWKWLQRFVKKNTILEVCAPENK